MIHDLLKWSFKLGVNFIVWVFILSIQWDRKSLYEHAHEIIVVNPLVELVDEEIRILWDKVADSAQMTYAELRKRNAKSDEIK